MGLNKNEKLVLTKEQKKTYRNKYIKIMGSVLVLIMTQLLGVIALVKMLFLPGVDLPFACLLITAISIIMTHSIMIIKWSQEEIEYLIISMEKKQKKNKRRLK